MTRDGEAAKMIFMMFGIVSPAAVAIVSGAFLSGAMMSLFLLTIPVLLETSTSSKHLLGQWNLIFYRGHIQGPVISIATSLIHLFAAWLSGEPLYAVAAAITTSMIPYTWLFMRNVNNALFEAVQWTDDIKETRRSRVEDLVVAWSRFNAVRALFPLTGAALGVAILASKARDFTTR